MSFINELKRRNVIRVGVAYVVTAWIIIQVVETLFPVFDLSKEAIRIVVISLAIGLFPALFYAWAFELTPEGLKRDKDVDRSHSITRQTGKKLDRWLIVLLALALAYFAFDKFVLDPDRDAELVETAVQVTEQAVLNRTPEKSIAVLPFINMSADPDQEFFSDGITEEILNSLAQVQAFKVAGRTSSFAFKGRNEDLRTIGEALNVAHVLEGSVRRSGNQLRITAQLIKVDDGYHLWSQTFDRDLTDVFAIQDEIALAILERLKSELLGEGPGLTDSIRTDTDVYELYLQATQLIYQRTQSALETAAELLTRAIIQDPGYAPAHAQRGIIWLLLSEKLYGDIPFEYADSQGKKQLDTALVLDPKQAQALAGLGLYHVGRVGESSQAVKVLESALSINPNLINALNWLNSAKAIEGDEVGALAIIEKLVEVDPLFGPGMSNAVQMYNKRGLQDKSWELLRRVKLLSSDHIRILHSEAATHFSLGQFAKGLPLMESVFSQQPNYRHYKVDLNAGWYATNQFKRLQRDGTKSYQSFALMRLGQMNEALAIAYEIVESEGDVHALFSVLNASDRSKELVTFMNKQWNDFDENPTRYANLQTGYYILLNEIALAYLRTGDLQKSDKALRLERQALDHLYEQGWSSIDLSFNEAVYHALSGNVDIALDHLLNAVDNGYIGPTPLAKFKPAFKILEDNLRYQEIHSKMTKHLNEEREALGLRAITEEIMTPD